MAPVLIPSPSIKLTSFACPHCGAHATQHWLRLYLDQYPNSNPTPRIWSEDDISQLEVEIRKTTHDEEARAPLEAMVDHFKQVLQGAPFMGVETDKIPYRAPPLENVFVSRCYTCGKLAIWLHDRLLYPPLMAGPSPNGDLSDDVLRDYEEARSILDLSPRGAAALLRLAVEKMCIELGANGKDINQRIASLVAGGLPEPVQKALDAVRVIGNEAVHPGQLDLRDDRDTATRLFGLVNFIAEDRITRPKQLAGLYDMIPEEKQKAIDERNARALGETK